MAYKVIKNVDGSECKIGHIRQIFNGKWIWIGFVSGHKNCKTHFETANDAFKAIKKVMRLDGLQLIEAK